MKACGHHAHNSEGLVGVKVDQAAGRAGFSGLVTCGSVWACPVCSAKIAAHRQSEIAAAVTTAQARGLDVIQLTLTMRHKAGQRLKTLWDGLSYAWGKVTSGRAWNRDQDAYGVHGWVRVVEVTTGCSGWHVHVHALLFCQPAALVETADLGPVLFQRWRSALMRKGFAAPIATRGGLDVKVLDGDASNLGHYFAKGAVYRSAAEQAGLEVARADLKSGRPCDRCKKPHRQPFQLLADLIATGDAEDLDDWHEWERASKGRRQLTWSRGIRAELLSTEAERTDEEIAAEAPGGDLVVLLPAATWAVIRHDCASLLDAAEDGRAVAYLERLGLDWLPPPG